MIELQSHFQLLPLLQELVGKTPCQGDTLQLSSVALLVMSCRY